jgi:predicted nucleotidyltransferase
MQTLLPNFPLYPQIENALSPERLQAYATKSPPSPPNPSVTLARYLLNMALCESLYSPLQLCEIALRNAIHKHAASISKREDWYDCPEINLTPWALEEVRKAKTKIHKLRKTETASRVISELQFGFWTSLFEAHYEQKSIFLPSGIKAVFPHLAKSLHKRKERKSDLESIRLLRNRIFHHERIVHLKDLNEQYERALQVIAWISPELHQMACSLDRFSGIRKAGLSPWLQKVSENWHQDELANLAAEQAKPPTALHLPARYLAMVQALLRQHLPQAQVWAYGSRARGDHYDASDLDLVARCPSDLAQKQVDLDRAREAFVESNLPIIVQIVDWARIPPAFHAEIQACYVPVQEASAAQSAPIAGGSPMKAAL